MKTIEVILSSKEIYFLCELLKVEFIVGLKDPYDGCREHQIREDWLQVKEGLIQKEILFERDTYEIERKCAILINAMRPESVCCWFSLIEDGHQKACHFYFTPQMVVKSTQIPNQDVYRVELAGTPKEILTEIIGQFSISTANVEGESFALPRAAFDALLVGRNQESLSSVEFLTSMKTLKKAGQLELVVWDDAKLTWNHEDFHFVEGENGVWVITPGLVDGEDQVFIEPASAREVEEHIKHMLWSRLFRAE
ncbi:hypothetical protein [Neobacillus dielmonensis]|uniref:hypothetical protein n=1 Tax=Neobacillus dielmonensis TaxID=1347369 RepID=UPI0005A68726|nr:hypothetical protein [Neobacillus dielmonensis]